MMMMLESLNSVYECTWVTTSSVSLGMTNYSLVGMVSVNFSSKPFYNFWPQLRSYFWGFTRLCPIWWKSTKKCDRESVHRRTHTHRRKKILLSVPYAICCSHEADNYVTKVSITTPIDVVFRFREIWPTWNRWNRALFTWHKTTQFHLPLKLSLLRVSRPKSARASPQQCSQSAPDFIRIGLLPAEL